MIGKKIIHLDTVESTNNYVANLFKKGEIDAGTIVMADVQTLGKGQRGNSWQSQPYANLTFSFPLDSNQVSIKNIFSINHTISLAVYDFVAKYCDNTSIKWPNDTYVNTKKIAGILIENQLDSSGFKLSIIGIGINVNQLNFDQLNATSLAIEKGKNFNTNELIHEIASCINTRLQGLAREGEDKTKELFDKKLWLRNIPHIFKDKNGIVNGEIIGTTKEGLLIIKTNGEQRLYSNGEISYFT